MRAIFFILCFLFQSLHADEASISQNALDVAANNRLFCFDLYKNLKEAEGNFCFSPYSISSALAMVYNGAKEETQKEMSEVLKFHQPVDALNEGFSFLNHFFTKITTEITTDYKVDITNSLWIQTGVAVLPEFLDQLGKYFKVSLRRVDFLRQKESARREINLFVKEKTFGKISDLVGPDDIIDSTKMLLVSSIYMKAKWALRFEESSTKMEPFFVNKETTISAPMMRQTAHFPCFKSEHFTAVTMPYVQLKENGPALQFLILLPNKNFGIAELEKSMSDEVFKKIITELESEEITLIMPKFKFTKGFSLKNSLTAMGMKTAFEREADFSGITGSKDLQMGQVAHKVFIAVDENGTEAAAATSVSMNLKAIFDSREPWVFQADHPFMFVIYEKLTSSILFCGRITNPI